MSDGLESRITVRRVHISSIKSGDKIGKTILTASGNTLIGYGVILNERYIERLRILGTL